VLRLLEYCIKNGAYTGCEFNTADEETEDLLSHLSDLKLDGNMKRPLSFKMYQHCTTSSYRISAVTC